MEIYRRYFTASGSSLSEGTTQCRVQMIQVNKEDNADTEIFEISVG